MKKKLKHISIISFILALLFVLAGLFLMKYNSTNANADKAVIDKKPEPAVKPAVNKQEAPKKAAEPQLQVKFNSNEEIKKMYGRLEIVYLFDGREYTGVVLSVEEYYTMVTVDGIKKIPMKDVKVRVLLDN
ncbi:MAG: hypothetical protein JXN64_07135 [Spirochaetes bacterium]|nr:hypothetical protein [Spirochaetota bacterium]